MYYLLPDSLFFRSNRTFAARRSKLGGIVIKHAVNAGKIFVPPITRNCQRLMSLAIQVLEKAQYTHRTKIRITILPEYFINIAAKSNEKICGYGCECSFMNDASTSAQDSVRVLKRSSA
jgi:hypothetical protein